MQTYRTKKQNRVTIKNAHKKYRNNKSPVRDLRKANSTEANRRQKKKA